MKKVFNLKYAKDMAKGHDIKVVLKKNYKGISLFSKKPIKKGSVVAYYKFLVNKYDDNFKGHNNDMYTMTVYGKRGRARETVMGDIYDGSLLPPKNGITYWAYFSNEPSGDQEENVYLDINTSFNYKNRDRVNAGDTMIYKLMASRDIKPNEEITWCYGDFYNRNYKANC